MLTEKTFTVNGYSMNYAEGPRSGAPLIFLHGATLWWQDFEPLSQSLEQSWHIHACDMRGHGKSSRTPGKYRAVDFCPDIAALIQQQIKQPAVLVGHSNGGTISLLTAAQFPELVKAIILLDPSVGLRNSTVQSMSIGEWFAGVTDIFNGMLSVKDGVSSFMLDIGEAELPEIESMIRSVDPEFVSVMLNNNFFDDLDLEQAANKVKCPTLLLYGELELQGIVRDSDVEFLKRHIPQIVAHQIKGAGHSPHWTQTETTLEHISSFLKII